MIQLKNESLSEQDRVTGRFGIFHSGDSIAPTRLAFITVLDPNDPGGEAK
jgi:hypothetical protein